MRQRMQVDATPPAPVAGLDRGTDPGGGAPLVASLLAFEFTFTLDDQREQISHAILDVLDVPVVIAGSVELHTDPRGPTCAICWAESMATPATASTNCWCIAGGRAPD
jgi:hypothetical protein